MSHPRTPVSCHPCDRFRHAVLPSSALHQIIAQQGDNVIGLKERSVFVDDTEAVGVAVSGDRDLRLGLAHLLFSIFEQMIIRFGRMPTEQYIAVIMNRA